MSPYIYLKKITRFWKCRQNFSQPIIFNIQTTQLWVSISTSFPTTDRCFIDNRGTAGSWPIIILRSPNRDRFDHCSLEDLGHFLLDFFLFPTSWFQRLHRFTATCSLVVQTVGVRKPSFNWQGSSDSIRIYFASSYLTLFEVQHPDLA